MHWLRMFHWCMVRLEKESGRRRRVSRRPTELDAAVFQITLEVSSSIYSVSFCVVSEEVLPCLALLRWTASAESVARASAVVCRIVLFEMFVYTPRLRAYAFVRRCTRKNTVPSREPPARRYRRFRTPNARTTYHRPRTPTTSATHMIRCRCRSRACARCPHVRSGSGSRPALSRSSRCPGYESCRRCHSRSAFC